MHLVFQAVLTAAALSLSFAAHADVKQVSYRCEVHEHHMKVTFTEFKEPIEGVKSLIPGAASYKVEYPNTPAYDWTRANGPATTQTAKMISQIESSTYGETLWGLVFGTKSGIITRGGLAFEVRNLTRFPIGGEEIRIHYGSSRLEGLDFDCKLSPNPQD